MRNYYYFLMIVLCVPLLLGGCRTQHAAQSTDIAAPSPSVILFISLKIRHDTLNDSYRVDMVNVRRVQGTFKEVSSEADTANYPDYVICTLATKEGVILKSLVVEHPLYRRFEYESKEGRLAAKTVALDSAQFAIRTLCPSGLGLFVVSQVLHKSKPEKLGSFNITCDENDH
jgi:hypothetical protein